MSMVLAAIVWLMVLGVCVADSYTYAGPVNSEDDPLRRGLWLALVAASALIILLRLECASRVLRNTNVFYVTWVGLALVSDFWSVDTELTSRKLVRLMMMFAGFLAASVAAWEPRRFQHVLRPVLTLLVYSSIVFALGWPALALHHEPEPELINAWHGVCLTKNQLGAVASFTLILWIHAWLTNETRAIKAFLGAGGALLCLIMSRSQTSLIASIIAAVAMVLLLRGSPTMRRRAPLIVSVFAGILMLFALAMLNVIPGLRVILEPIPLITGKTLTFSNRAQIWAVVMEHVRLRPLLGSGYGAFWLPNLPTPDKDSYFVLARLNGLYPGSSHNGYLQVLNDLGFVGLSVLLGYIFIYFRQSLRLYYADAAQGALYIGILLQQTTINTEEPNWLNSIMLDFVPMSLGTLFLARALSEISARTDPVRKSSLARYRELISRRATRRVEPTSTATAYSRRSNQP